VTDCTPTRLEFARCQRRRVEMEFSGGEISSDDGVLVLSELDRQLGLTAALDQVLRWCEREDVGYIRYSAHPERIELFLTRFIIGSFQQGRDSDGSPQRNRHDGLTGALQ